MDVTFTKLADSYGLILEAADPQAFLKLGRDTLHARLNEHGVLLFRSQRTIQRDIFVKLSDGFSQHFIIHGAKVRRPMSEDGTVQTVTEGPGAIVLHAEMHFSPFSPDYMWFFCETAPAQGGETTICDGELFYQHLSPASQQLLQAKKLKYWNLWDAEVWQKYFSGSTEQEIIQIFARKGARSWFNVHGELEFEVCKPALSKTATGRLAFVNSIAVHDQYTKNLRLFEADGQASKVRHRITFEDGSEIPRGLLDELAQIENQLTLPLRWRDGDLVLLDNNRVLHGRRSFDPAVKRTILVRMAMAA